MRGKLCIGLSCTSTLSLHQSYLHDGGTRAKIQSEVMGMEANQDIVSFVVVRTGVGSVCLCVAELVFLVRHLFSIGDNSCSAVFRFQAGSKDVNQHLAKWTQLKASAPSRAKCTQGIPSDTKRK